MHQPGRAYATVLGSFRRPRFAAIATPNANALLSVVVPCFNEEGVLREMHQRLSAVLGEAPSLDVEFVCVDDGSRDGTLAVLRELQRGDPRLRVVALSRNFGQLAATTAGMAEARGDAVVTIDADLQDPPEAILDMVARWRDGVQVAYGVRETREGEVASKRWASKVFSRFMNRLSGGYIPVDSGDFFLLDRKVVHAFLAMPERDRYHRGMVAWTGFRQEAVHFHRRARAAGETKYTKAMMWRLAIDGLMSFSLLPVRLALWSGVLVAGLAFAGLIVGLTARLLTDGVPGWMLVCALVLFVAGVQLAFIGVLGEYVGRIYGEVKRRPLYLVKERIGFPKAPPER